MDELWILSVLSIRKQVWKSELSRILFSFWMREIQFPLLLVIVRK